MNGTQVGTKHILLVEDDVAVGTLLAEVLQDAGYRATLAPSGAEAKAFVDQDRPDLIVLDLRLPDTDGLVLCADLQSRVSAPLMVVSASSEKRDAILAVKLGADDFVAKPFDVDHLLARIEATLRRHAMSAAVSRTLVSAPEAPALNPQAADDGRVRRVGTLTMDHARRLVSVGGRTVGITPTEYRILQALIERPDEVVTRDELAMKVWGFQDAGIGRSIDVHIRRLRLKLEGGDVAPPSIVAVRGFGYKVLPQPEAALAA
jgi:two-component system, OmpR family, response regulator